MGDPLNDLLDVMHAWMAGHSTTSMELWSINMIWWGRIGKMSQFVGALTVVLDIAGPDRLRTWSLRFRSNPLPGAVTRLLTSRPSFPELTWPSNWLPSTRFKTAVGIAVVVAAVAWWPRLLAMPLMPSFWLADWMERTRLYDALDWAFNSYLLCPAMLVMAFLLSLLFVLADELKKSGHKTSSTAVKAVSKILMSGGLLLFFLILMLPLMLSLMLAAAGIFLAFLLVSLAMTAVRTALYLIDLVLQRPLIWVMDREYPGNPVRIVGVFLVAMGFFFDLLSS